VYDSFGDQWDEQRGTARCTAAREGGRGGEGGADIRGIGERWESNWKLKDSKFRNFCTYVYYIFAGICYTL
jgi:hypothetical protein